MLWDLSTNQWLMSFSFVCCAAFVCGWVADRILGYSGFGTLGNWLLLTLGAYVGLYSYNIYGLRFSGEPGMTIAVAFGAGLLMLMLLTTGKAIFRI